MLVLRKEPIRINEGRERVRLKVTNTGDRPIQVRPHFSYWVRALDLTSVAQVGSHYHFTEVNRALSFDRRKAFFKRLDIAAGTAVRFEPGDTKTVTLVQIGGEQVVTGAYGTVRKGLFSCPDLSSSTGGNLLLNSSIARHLADPSLAESTMQRIVSSGFSHVEDPSAVLTSDTSVIAPFEVSRETYASMFGPTTGDRVRLGDTSLWIEVERDETHYGDECKFGGGASACSL